MKTGKLITAVINLILAICSTSTLAQMPAAISVSPEISEGQQEITLTLDPTQACVPGSGSLIGAAIVGMHSSAILEGESYSDWSHTVGFTENGNDGTVPVLTDNGDGTYSITFTPSDFYGTGSAKMIGISAVFNNGTDWTNQASDYNGSGCIDFHIPLKSGAGVNYAPANLMLDNHDVLEQLPVGSLAGRFITDDPNPEDDHIYTLVPGAGDSDNGSFTIEGDSLLTAEVFDYTLQDQYAIRVRTTDTGSLYLEKQTYINILLDQSIERPPFDITLSNSTAFENILPGTVIGVFETADYNESDTHEYSFVSGLGDEDNESFQIIVDSLVSMVPFDALIQDTFKIRIRSTDPTDYYVEKQFQIIIVNDTLTGVAFFQGTLLLDMVWAADTVYITGNVHVPLDKKLTVTSGTCVQLEGDYLIDVSGLMMVKGMPGDSVLFESKFPGGHWDGIKLHDRNASDTSYFNYLILKHGSIETRYYSNIQIANSLIDNNNRTSGNIGINNWYTNLSISNSSVINSYTGIWVENGSGFINNCFISNNSSEGIRFYNSEGAIYNSVITNNGRLGFNNYYSLLLWNSNIDVLNCVVGNNLEGCYVRWGNPVFRNTIIWGNGDNNVVIGDIGSKPVFRHCDIEDGFDGFILDGGQFNGQYEDNINLDPEFISPSPGLGQGFNGLMADWHLPVTSPCINGGDQESNIHYPDTDLDGNPRVKHGIIDIGPYEYYQESIEASTLIASDTLWIADTIHIKNYVIIPDSVTLRIAPGTVVLSHGYQKILCEGCIKAIGTASAKIKFTVADTNGLSNRSNTDGSWAGIRISSDSVSVDTSEFRYCIIEYVKNLAVNATLHIDHADAIVTNCLIKHNFSAFGGSGIWSNGANTIIDANEFCHNENNEMFTRYGGTVLNGFDPGNPIITNNYIHHNYANECAGITSGNEAFISGNIICHNTSYNDFRGASVVLGSEPLFTNNIISNNDGIGVYIHESSEPTLINNIICNNTGFYYSAIRIYDYAKATIINNTICNNYAGSDGGWAVSIGKGSKSSFINNIFYGNSNSAGHEKYFNLEGKNFSSFSYNLMQALDDAFIISDYQGSMTYNFDSLPYFTKITVSAGREYETQEADWSLLAFSPAINAGLDDPPDHELPATDFLGQPRINSIRIDLGAIENQGSLVTVIKQPDNLIKCENETARFKVQASDTAMYQWKKDGLVIEGANGPVLEFDSVVLNDQGNYRCLVSNTFGTAESNPAYLFVNENPEFILEPSDQWVKPGVPAILRTYAKGNSLIYSWQKDDSTLSGIMTPDLTIPDPNIEDEGSYTCIISNSCGADTTESMHLFLAPELCMVTVSPTTGYNLVVWEKKSNAQILAYNIYRESAAAGIYDRLETIPFDDLSVFVDTMADPTVQAYLYKITALDTAGAETDIDLCKPHKTIHLIVSTNPELNTTQLQWDRYYGFDYQTYTIYRSNTGLNFDPVGSLSANLNSWTDPDPLTGDLFYRIAVEKPVPCIPEGGGKKAGTGPYHHSLSNMDDNKLQAGQQPPDTITLNNNSIEEENLPGRMIGKLFTEDKDSLDSHTYKFVPGDGDDDNISFTLMGDLLLASESFDYETKNQYSVRIRSTDEAGNYCEVPFIIQVINVDETTGLPVLNTGAVKAFPNPFSRFTSISFPNPAGKSYRLVLMDLSGKVIRMKESITSGKFILKRDGLEKGMYIIELRGDKTYRGKLVIE